MSRVKRTAWRGLCGPELNKLAVWVQRFNEDPDNGYAVMRLRAADGTLIVYDGISGDLDPVGEFYCRIAVDGYVAGHLHAGPRVCWATS